jgi:hypothetical protein
MHVYAWKQVGNPAIVGSESAPAGATLTPGFNAPGVRPGSSNFSTEAWRLCWKSGDGCGSVVAAASSLSANRTRRMVKKIT